MAQNYPPPAGCEPGPVHPKLLQGGLVFAGAVAGYYVAGPIGAGVVAVIGYGLGELIPDPELEAIKKKLETQDKKDEAQGKEIQELKDKQQSNDPTNESPDETKTSSGNQNAAKSGG